MGLDPNADADIRIRNGTFWHDAEWDLGPGWSIVGGKARFANIEPGGAMRQFVLGAVPYNQYRLKFTILNNNPPGQDSITLYVHLNQYEPPWSGRANGNYEIDIIAGLGIDEILFQASGAMNGWGFDLDNISIEPLGDYVATELGILTQTPFKKEVHSAVAAEVMHLVASYKDRTNVLVLYNT